MTDEDKNVVLAVVVQLETFWQHMLFLSDAHTCLRVNGKSRFLPET